MQKSTSKKLKTFGLIALCFSFAIISFLTAMPTNSFMAVGATLEVFKNNLAATMTVTAKNSAHSTASFNDSAVALAGDYTTDITRCYSYAWKNVKYFEIEMGDLSTAIPVSAGEYQYSYEVTYVPTTISAGVLNYANEATMHAVIYSGTAQNKEGIKNKVYFFIDDNMERYGNLTSMEVKANAYDLFKPTDETNEDVYTNQGGWGVYIFTFKSLVGNKETSGTIMYELTPTSLTELADKTLTVSAEKSTPGVSSINDGWIFYVNEDFQYVNRKNIVWSVSGTGSDGTKYVLREQDKTAENEKLIGANLPYTGASLKLDTAIQGNWVATATITEGSDTKVASSEEVSTIKPFSTTAIIWIVTGVTVVAVAIVAVIIVVNIKKEKTW